jgi:hypothetical protein
MSGRSPSPFANLGRQAPTQPLEKAVLRSTRDQSAAAPMRPDDPQSPVPTESPPLRDQGPESTFGSPPERPYARTGVRRVITRYAFEFYQDQLEDLRRLSLRDKMAGERGSMSEMVREALDQYLSNRRTSAR